MNQESTHVPVLLNEAIEALHVQPGRRYVDCTVGPGGHAEAILQRGGRLLAIDIDPQTIDLARQRLSPYGPDAIVVKEDFQNLRSVCADFGFIPADGVLFDLGVSSFQLDSPDRGFSFQHDALLNMRFNTTQHLTAAAIVNTYPEREIATILEKYGEEHRGKRIARSIVANRPIETTAQLATVVERCVGSRGRIHPATKTFQALRIMVNQELARLERALEQVVEVLGTAGRLVVISFHSLEDRLVKNFMRRESKDCICPPEVPVCTCGHKATLSLPTRKAVTPSSSEVAANPRSRSARMRVAERI